MLVFIEPKMEMGPLRSRAPWMFGFIGKFVAFPNCGDRNEGGRTGGGGGGEITAFAEMPSPGGGQHKDGRERKRSPSPPSLRNAVVCSQSFGIGILPPIRGRRGLHVDVLLKEALLGRKSR